MKVLTEGKTIDLDSYGLIGYDFDRAMVYFDIGNPKVAMYFESNKKAMSFMDELIAALANKADEVDLTHYSIYFGTIYISQLKEYYRKEEEKYECNENR
mgnify:CR=1 FL=1